MSYVKKDTIMRFYYTVRLPIIVMLVLLLTALAYARAQASKILRVGAVSVQPLEAPSRVAFLSRMAELGYVQGENFVFEFVQAAGIADYNRAYQELALPKAPSLLIWQSSSQPLSNWP